MAETMDYDDWAKIVEAHNQFNTTKSDQCKQDRKSYTSNSITGLYNQGENKMTAYEKQTIKSFMDIQYGSGASIEHLTMAYGYFGTIIKFIEEAGYDVPGELIQNRDCSKRDLDIKLKDARKAEITSIKRELDGLQSAEEKRGRLQEKLAKLEAMVI